MMTAGEKIKRLRKELKLTQTDLAGEELTKSMLSQIENNQSNPSLKTLKYIAGRLNRPITYFLEEPSDPEAYSADSDVTSEPLMEQIRRINELIETDSLPEAQKEAEELFMGKLPGKISKSAADVTLKLGVALVQQNRLREGQKYLNQAIERYIDGAFLFEGAKAYVELAKTYYQKFDYRECLAIADKAFALYDRSISKDPLFEIELYYYKILILFALGDLKQAADAIQAAFALSEKTAVYYKTDDLYRLNGIFYFLINNDEAYEQNIEKALQFAVLTNDNDCLARIYAMKGIAAVENYQAEDVNFSAQLALEYAEKSRHYWGREVYIYHFIKARAYFLLENYEAAYDAIKKVDYPAYETHKFDYLNMWSAKVYEGLILNRLGKNSAAIEAIKTGMEKMSVVGDSKFLVFAHKSISEVYSSMADYQNAFLYLKIANEIQDRINADGSIIF